jgi:hypothetical protein
MVLDDLIRDGAYGIRLLRRAPAYSAVVIATLAAGIGATVTVFSIVDAWLLRPLAFPHADRLVVGLAATRERPAEPAVFLPYRSYVAWKERSRSFDVVSATFRRSFLISGQGDATAAMGLAVSDEFFQTMGVAPELGRALGARRERRCGGHQPWLLGASVRTIGRCARHADHAERPPP